MRALPFLLCALLVVGLLLPYLRQRGRPAPPGPPSERDQLVKDPVCQTYVVRSRALCHPGLREPVYFCSAECARRWGALSG
jgi:hypothetical protein